MVFADRGKIWYILSVEQNLRKAPFIIMTITPHLLTGAAIATATTTNLPVAFLLGFLSHFILDALPHTDPGTFFMAEDPEHKEDYPWPLWIYIFAASEFILIWTLVIILFKNRPDFVIIMIGGLGGIAVDVLDSNPTRFLKNWPIVRQIHWLHHRVHFELKPNQWYWGFLFQVVVIGGLLWYLLKF